MNGKSKTPEPLAGGDRGLKLIEAAKLDSPEDNSCSVNSQTNIVLIDSERFPIIARHWFGIEVAEARAA